MFDIDNVIKEGEEKDKTFSKELREKTSGGKFNERISHSIDSSLSKREKENLKKGNDVDMQPTQQESGRKTVANGRKKTNNQNSTQVTTSAVTKKAVKPTEKENNETRINEKGSLTASMLSKANSPVSSSHNSITDSYNEELVNKLKKISTAYEDRKRLFIYTSDDLMIRVEDARKDGYKSCEDNYKSSNEELKGELLKRINDGNSRNLQLNKDKSDLVERICKISEVLGVFSEYNKEKIVGKFGKQFEELDKKTKSEIALQLVSAFVNYWEKGNLESYNELSSKFEDFREEFKQVLAQKNDSEKEKEEKIANLERDLNEATKENDKLKIERDNFRIKYEDIIKKINENRKLLEEVDKKEEKRKESVDSYEISLGEEISLEESEMSN